MAEQALTRDARKSQVEAALALNLFNDYGEDMTAREIARAVGVKPSTKFYQILSEMCWEGRLIATKNEWNCGIVSWRWLYRLSPGNQARKKFPKLPKNARDRVIAVNSAGKRELVQVGMFDE